MMVEWFNKINIDLIQLAQQSSVLAELPFE
jgi:hypothetical protein